MSVLPVPASVYFKDFDFDSLMYTVSKSTGEEFSVKGIPNKEHGVPYVSFPIETAVAPGDIIRCSDGVYTVSRVSIDTYNGEPQIVNAFL